MTSTWKGVTVGAWLLAVLCASVWAELDSRLDDHWELWKKTHQKKYQNEELRRRELWEEHFYNISRHNLGASLGLHTYTRAINHLSDLTADEKRQRIPPLTLPEDFKMTTFLINVTEEDLPSDINWKDGGIVTPVKDQGNCASGWAFSAAGALEGLNARSTRSLVELSAQQLMDCSKPYGSYGCHQGWMHEAFQFVMNSSGICSEACYPYKAKDDICRRPPDEPTANCSSYSLFPQDEFSLQWAICFFGPISVAIDAGDIFDYSSGVYNSSSCGNQMNHGVLLVGYDTDLKTGQDYWLIKNSWGTSWGEDGYMRLARNQNQMCGISLYSVYPQ